MLELIRNDLYEGTRPAMQWFRAAAFFTEYDPITGDFVTPTALLCDWIERYDRWYKVGTETGGENRLHLLYNREVTLVDSIDLRAVVRIVEIADACKSAGIGFGLTVDLNDGIADPDSVERVLACGSVSSVGFVCYLDRPEPDLKRAAALIERALENGMDIALIGPHDFFERSGLLAAELLNRSNVTLYPTRSALEEPLAQQTPVRACFGRLRIHIDIWGNMFPCFGMMGLPFACLGNIRDDFSETALGGQPFGMNLVQLVRDGPRAQDLVDGEAPGNLPPVCAAHRAGVARMTRRGDLV